MSLLLPNDSTIRFSLAVYHVILCKKSQKVFCVLSIENISRFKTIFSSYLVLGTVKNQLKFTKNSNNQLFDRIFFYNFYKNFPVK